MFELGEQGICCVIRKANVPGHELLIQDRSAKETRELLFVEGVVRVNQRVAQAGKDKSGDVTLKRFEKRQLAFGEGKHRVALAELDIVIGRNRVDRLVLKSQRIERSEHFSG